MTKKQKRRLKENRRENSFECFPKKLIAKDWQKIPEKDTEKVYKLAFAVVEGNGSAKEYSKLVKKVYYE